MPDVHVHPRQGQNSVTNRSLGGITRFTKRRTGSHNGKANHGNHIDPPITSQPMRSPLSPPENPPLIPEPGLRSTSRAESRSIPVLATSRGG